MQQRKKSNSVVTHVLGPDGILTFNVVGAGSFTFDPAGCNDDVERRAALHGYIQRISDRAAIQRDPDTGKSATPQEKFDAMRECAERLQSGGAWEQPRGEGMEQGGLLYRAMSALFPHSWATRKDFGAYLETAAAERKTTVAKVRKSLAETKMVKAKMDELREPADSAIGDEIIEGLQ